MTRRRTSVEERWGRCGVRRDKGGGGVNYDSESERWV